MQKHTKKGNEQGLFIEFDEAEGFWVTIINASCIKSRAICIADD